VKNAECANVNYQFVARFGCQLQASLPALWVGMLLSACGTSQPDPVGLLAGASANEPIAQYATDDFVPIPKLLGRARPVPLGAAGGTLVIQVLEGDTIYSISDRYRVAAYSVVRANAMTSYDVYAGQTLFIPLE
jgi:LysM domain